MLSPDSNLMIQQFQSNKYEKLLPSFQLVCLEADELIFRPHEAIQFVYFPVSAIIAMQIDISDGSSADIVLIGKEGMVGSGVMGGNQNFSRARVKFSGFAYKLPLTVFQSELAQDSGFLKIWMATTRQMILQIAMPTICSSKHTNEQQIIRWIMNTLDKTQGHTLEITHQEIGLALLQRMREELADLIVVEQFPKLEGRQMVMMIAPGKKKPGGAAKPAQEMAA